MTAVRRSLLVLVSVLVPAAAPQAGSAQEPGIKFAIGNFGLGLGDVPRIDGLRLNFRDRHLEEVRGINATIWMPYQRADGVVKGVALGVPLTGAREISGLALGVGIGAEERISGISFAPLGIGAGQGGIHGISVSGIGMGTGGDLSGIAVGGVGLGAGGDVTGIAVGGVGLGSQGRMRGIAVGGVGAGFGGGIEGIAVGGVGIGTGGDVKGITVGGVGVGAGGDVEGLVLGGVGVGVGGEMRGVAVGGVGVGAREVTGLVLAGFGAGGEEIRGVVVAPAYFNVTPGGEFHGVSVSAWNRIQGVQRGLTIGLLNVTDELHGLQVGLINIARNKKSFSVMPLFNYSR